MRDIKIFNVVFPLWFMMFVPPFIFIPLVSNFIIDSIVIYLTLRSNHFVLSRKKFWRLVFFAWIFGFIADLIGAGLLLLFSVYFNIDSYRIWTDPITVFLYLFSVIVTGVMIGGFNLWLCKKCNIPMEVSCKVGLTMGIITAPWLFLIPSVVLN